MSSVTIKDTEHANFQGMYYFLEIPPLTYQQEQFVLLVFRGMSVQASCRAVGLSDYNGRKLLKEERVMKVLGYLREQMFQDTRITLESLNSMAMEAHRKSMTATEELNAVNTLAKLNMVGGYAPKSVIDARLREAEVKEEKEVPVNSMNQLERMEEAKLLELANLGGMDSLNPQPTKRKVSAELKEGDPWPEELDDLSEINPDDIEVVTDDD